MIIVELNGALGNQMFQYAFGRALSLKLGLTLKFIFVNYRGDVERKYSLGCFNVKIDLVNQLDVDKLFPSLGLNWLAQKYILKLSNIYYEKDYPDFVREIAKFKNVYLKGFWQSEKYFRDYEKLIRKDFRFIDKPNTKNLFLLGKIKPSDSVFVHVRRRDYINNKDTNKLHGTMDVGYYQQATSLIKKSVKDPTFFVFSDDISWCKQNFKFLKSAIFVDNNLDKKDYEDLRLMSICKHSIIANSSFSWWGAWLNNNAKKIVIAPKKWFRSSPINMDDRIPESWITI